MPYPRQQAAQEQIRLGTVTITNNWYKEMGLSFYGVLSDSSHRQFNEGTNLLFKESKSGELLNFFKKQSEAGNGYVVYDPLLPITTMELRCFELFVDAQMHCYENSKDFQHFCFTTIDQMQMELHFSKDINLLEGYVQNLEPKMKYADWTWDYSDDHEVRMRGADEINKIQSELKKFCQVPGGMAKANELWDQYVPENTYRKPDFMLMATIKDYKIAVNESPVAEQVGKDHSTIGLHTSGRPEITVHQQQTTQTNSSTQHENALHQPPGTLERKDISNKPDVPANQKKQRHRRNLK